MKEKPRLLEIMDIVNIDRAMERGEYNLALRIITSASERLDSNKTM